MNDTVSRNVQGGILLPVYAFCIIGCAGRSEFGAPTASAGRAVASPTIDRVFIYARNWPTEEVELVLIRRGGKSTVELFRPARDGRPRFLLESIGPVRDEPDEIRVMLETFDVWELNAPNAVGAACRTVNGSRSCAPTSRDYSVVMRVESGGRVRVQRYTGLERSPPSRPVRRLGDYVLEWARKSEGAGKRP